MVSFEGRATSLFSFAYPLCLAFAALCRVNFTSFFYLVSFLISQSFPTCVFSPKTNWRTCPRPIFVLITSIVAIIYFLAQSVLQIIYWTYEPNLSEEATKILWYLGLKDLVHISALDFCRFFLPDPILGIVGLSSFFVMKKWRKNAARTDTEYFMKVMESNTARQATSVTDNTYSFYHHLIGSFALVCACLSPCVLAAPYAAFVLGMVVVWVFKGSVTHDTRVAIRLLFALSTYNSLQILLGYLTQFPFALPLINNPVSSWFGLYDFAQLHAWQVLFYFSCVGLFFVSCQVVNSLLLPSRAISVLQDQASESDVSPAMSARLVFRSQVVYTARRTQHEQLHESDGEDNERGARRRSTPTPDAGQEPLDAEDGGGGGTRAANRNENKDINAPSLLSWFKYFVLWFAKFGPKILLLPIVAVAISIPSLLSFGLLLQCCVGLFLRFDAFGRLLRYVLVYCVASAGLQYMWALPNALPQGPTYALFGLKPRSLPIAFLGSQFLLVYFVALADVGCAVWREHEAQQRRRNRRGTIRALPTVETIKSPRLKMTFQFLWFVCGDIVINHSNKLTLVLLYFAGLSSLDLIHGIYMLFFQIYFIFPDIAKRTWSVLVYFSQIVVCALYFCDVAFPDLADTTIGFFIGLKRSSSEWQGLWMHILIVLFGEIQLAVYKRFSVSLNAPAVKPRTRRLTLSTTVTKAVATFKVPRAVRAVTLFIELLFLNGGLLMCYLSFLLVAFMQPVSFAAFGFLLFLLVCLCAHAIRVNSVSFVTRFWYVIVIYSGVVLLGVYLYQYSFIPRFTDLAKGRENFEANLPGCMSIEDIGLFEAQNRFWQLFPFFGIMLLTMIQLASFGEAQKIASSNREAISLLPKTLTFYFRQSTQMAKRFLALHLPKLTLIVLFYVGTSVDGVIGLVYIVVMCVALPMPSIAQKMWLPLALYSQAVIGLSYVIQFACVQELLPLQNLPWLGITPLENDDPNDRPVVGGILFPHLCVMLVALLQKRCDYWELELKQMDKSEKITLFPPPVSRRSNRSNSYKPPQPQPPTVTTPLLSGFSQLSTHNQQDQGAAAGLISTSYSAISGSTSGHGDGYQPPSSTASVNIQKHEILTAGGALPQPETGNDENSDFNPKLENHYEPRERGAWERWAVDLIENFFSLHGFEICILMFLAAGFVCQGNVFSLFYLPMALVLFMLGNNRASKVWIVLVLLMDVEFFVQLCLRLQHVADRVDLTSLGDYASFLSIGSYSLPLGTLSAQFFALYCCCLQLHVFRHQKSTAVQHRHLRAHAPTTAGERSFIPPNSDDLNRSLLSADPSGGISIAIGDHNSDDHDQNLRPDTSAFAAVAGLGAVGFETVQSQSVTSILLRQQKKEGTMVVSLPQPPELEDWTAQPRTTYNSLKYFFWRFSLYLCLFAFLIRGCAGSLSTPTLFDIGYIAVSLVMLHQSQKVMWTANYRWIRIGVYHYLVQICQMVYQIPFVPGNSRAAQVIGLLPQDIVTSGPYIIAQIILFVLFFVQYRMFDSESYILVLNSMHAAHLRSLHVGSFYEKNRIENLQEEFRKMDEEALFRSRRLSLLKEYSSNDDPSRRRSFTAFMRKLGRKTQLPSHMDFSEISSPPSELAVESKTPPIGVSRSPLTSNSALFRSAKTPTMKNGRSVSMSIDDFFEAPPPPPLAQTPRVEAAGVGMGAPPNISDEIMVGNGNMLQVTESEVSDEIGFSDSELANVLSQDSLSPTKTLFVSHEPSKFQKTLVRLSEWMIEHSDPLLPIIDSQENYSGPETMERKTSMLPFTTANQPSSPPSPWIHFFTAFSRFWTSHTHWWAYLMFCVNHLVHQSLVSAVYPVSVFGFALMQNPRPPKVYWHLMLAYAELLVGAKFVAQLPFDTQLPLVSSAMTFTGFVRVTRSVLSQYVAMDLICIVAVLFHRHVMKGKGLWRSVSTSDHHQQAEENNYNPQRPLDNINTRSPLSQDPENPTHQNNEKISPSHIQIDFPDHSGDAVGQPADDIEIQQVRSRRASSSAARNGYNAVHGKENMSRVSVWIDQLSQKFKVLSRDGKPGKDFYIGMFLAELISLLCIMFDFENISGASSVSQYISQNRIDGKFILFFFGQFLVIILDRVIYLYRSVLAKLVLQIFSVVFYHTIFFYAVYAVGFDLPGHLNASIFVLFLLKYTYLALSGLQICYNYPQRTTGQFLTRRYGFWNWLIFAVYRAIPFVFELRTLLDWTCTDTTLAMGEWFKFEDVYSELYSVKSDLVDKEDNPRKPGDKQPRYIKFWAGAILILALVIVLFFPLAYFSTFNPSLVNNYITSANAQLSFVGFGSFYSSDASPPQSLLSESQFEHLSQQVPDTKSVFDGPPQQVGFNQFSSTNFALSPPAEASLLNQLSQSSITIRLTVSLSRVGPPDAQTTSFSVDKQIDNSTLLEQFSMAVNSSIRTTSQSITLDGLYSPFVDVTNAGSVQLLGQGDPNLMTSCAITAQKGGGPMYFSLDCDPLDSALSSSGLFFYFANNQVPGDAAVASSLFSQGIIALYTTFVFAIARVLRFLFTGQMIKIMYNDLDDVDDLIQLCDDTMAAREYDLLLEEELFRELIKIYRSPELLQEITRSKKSKAE